MRYHMLTSDLLQRSARKARSLGHSYVGSAHLLLVLSREPGGPGQVLRQLGVDPEWPSFYTVPVPRPCLCLRV